MTINDGTKVRMPEEGTGDDDIKVNWARQWVKITWNLF